MPGLVPKLTCVSPDVFCLKCQGVLTSLQSLSNSTAQYATAVSAVSVGQSSDSGAHLYLYVVRAH